MTVVMYGNANISGSFPTLADIDESLLSDGNLVQTQGYNAVGDSGGNVYIYHTGVYSGDEDGGFYIFLTDGYLEAQNKTVAIPEQFGAVGDDTVDDIAALQSAADSEADIVELRKKYKISATLNLSTKKILRGSGRLTETTNLQPMVSITADDVSIKDLTLVGSQTVQGVSNDSAIKVMANRAFCQNLSISGKTVGFQLGIFGDDYTECRVVANDFTGFGSASGSLTNLVYMHGEQHIIANNIARKCGSLVTCGDVVKNAVIVGNHVNEFQDNGIYISSGEHCSVVANTCLDGFGSSGIKVRGRNNTVSGNTVKTIQQAGSGDFLGIGITVTSQAMEFASEFADVTSKFNSGSIPIRKSDILYGNTSAVTATVSEVWVDEGSWENGDAAGYILFEAGPNAYIPNEELKLTNVSGATHCRFVENVLIGGYGNVVNGNTIEDTGDAGISIGAASNGSNYYQHDTIVSNNTLINVCNGNRQSGGIKVGFVFRTTIENNRVENVRSAALGGMQITEAPQTSISGNTVKECQTGLYIQKSHAPKITGNDITGVASAIRFLSDTFGGYNDKAVISGNTIVGDITSEQLNCEIVDNYVQGRLVAICSKPEVMTYLTVRGNEFVPRRTVTAISIETDGGPHTINQIDISDNEMDVEVPAIYLATTTGSATTNQNIKRLLYNNNRVRSGATTVKAFTIFERDAFPYTIDYMEVIGGSHVSGDGFLEVKSTSTGTLRISGVQTETTVSDKELAIINGFAKIIVDANVLGDQTAAVRSGEIKIDSVAEVLVRDNDLYRLANNGLVCSASVSRVDWTNNRSLGGTGYPPILDPSTAFFSSQNTNLIEQLSDPADPAEGQSVIWQSDGTGSGNDGDLLAKVTAGGTTKTGTIFPASITSFDTPSDVPSTVAVGLTVETQGRTTVGDGGANRYVVVAGTTTYDGGFYIDIDGTKYLEALDKTVADPVYFGASGNDPAVDTAAIQSALDAAILTGKYAVRISDSYTINAPLQFKSFHNIRGLRKGGTGGGLTSTILVQGDIAGFEPADPLVATKFIKFENLIVQNLDSATPPAFASTRYGIDLDNCSHFIVRDCGLRNHYAGIRVGGNAAGYYNGIYDNEIANCNFGIRLEQAANSNRIIGGRITGCLNGIYATNCNDQFMSTSMERCTTGLYLDNDCRGFMAHNRYERTGIIVGSDPEDYSEDIDTGAVYLGPSTRGNYVFGYRSASTDRVIDLGVANEDHSTSTGYTGSFKVGYENLWENESFDVDTDGNGLADGVQMTPSIPANTVVSLDAADKVTGNYSQKIDITDLTSTRHPTLDTIEELTPGVEYVFACRVKVTYPAGFTDAPYTLYLGTSAGGSQYMNVPITQRDAWAMISGTFKATQADMFIRFNQDAALAAAGLSTLWIDSFFIGVGSKVPEFGRSANTSCAAAEQLRAIPDQDDPELNRSVIWQADSSSLLGSSGDLMVKSTDEAGTTKTGKLFDFGAAAVMARDLFRPEPPDPPEGEMILWASNGVGAGNPGDLMLKWNIGGTVLEKNLTNS